jgi:hypothetical protein
MPFASLQKFGTFQYSYSPQYAMAQNCGEFGILASNLGTFIL